MTSRSSIVDLLLRGRLDLQRLVDQVAQHLGAEPLDLLGRQLDLVRGHDQRQPLIDVAAGDDVAVDDRRRLADARILLADELDVVGDVERAGCRRCPPPCAAAIADSTGAISTIAAFANLPSFIIPPVKAGRYPAPNLLNRSLAASGGSLASQIAERHPNEEAVAAAGVAAGLIVAPPGQAKLDAIVVVEDAEPVADRLEAVGERQRILAAGW